MRKSGLISDVSEGIETEVLPLVKRTSTALDIGCRALTNRVCCDAVCFQLSTAPEDHIGQTADLGDRATFREDHRNKHKEILMEKPYPSSLGIDLA